MLHQYSRHWLRRPMQSSGWTCRKWRWWAARAAGSPACWRPWWAETSCHVGLRSAPGSLCCCSWSAQRAWQSLDCCLLVACFRMHAPMRVLMPATVLAHRSSRWLAPARQQSGASSCTAPVSKLRCMLGGQCHTADVAYFAARLAVPDAWAHRCCRQALLRL